MSRDQPSPVDASLAESTFVDFDAPRFWETHVVPIPSGFVRCDLRLHGIHCAACVWLLERLPQIQRGVLGSRVDLAKSNIELIWNPTQTRLSEIARQVARLGYRLVPIGSSAEERLKKQEQRKQLIQIAVAGACSGNVMLLALAIYAGEWSGIAYEHLQLLRFASTAVGLVSLLGPGSVFFRGAWNAIRTRTTHMDLPVALGLGVGAVSGAWNTLRGSGELYFDSLSMLVFFLLIGRALQSRQQQSACEAVDLLQQLTPGTALRVRDGIVEAVAIEELVTGDTVEVRANQTFPADGEVVQGASEIDASLLTGESLPIQVECGSEVVAGTLNRSSTLRVRVQKLGAETRIGQLMDSIHRASLSKAPIVQWADRISGMFVVIVLCLALVVGLSWWLAGSTAWADRVIALLIVACPCALGLATPLAIAVGLGRSARGGVLIKGGDTLQKLSQPGILVLDKTGTVTTGKLSIQEWHGTLTALEKAAAIELHHPHPVAVALRDHWRSRTLGDPLPEASEIESWMGSGVTGVVAGERIVVGNSALLEAQGIAIPSEFEEIYHDILHAGQSPLWVAVDGHVVAIGAIGDTIRAEARSVIARLKKQGWSVRMLSGDHPRIVEKVGNEIGLSSEERFGGVSPEEKLRWIQDWKQEASSLDSLPSDISSGKPNDRKKTPVLMVGDGVNDAAALAAADIGIAIRGGAEVSLQVADVFLANGSLEGIEEVIKTASKTMWVIGRNSVVSLFYNVSAVTLASLGWLHPLAAALLMPASSLTVLSITLIGYGVNRQKKFKAMDAYTREGTS